MPADITLKSVRYTFFSTVYTSSPLPYQNALSDYLQQEAFYQTPPFVLKIFFIEGSQGNAYIINNINDNCYNDKLNNISIFPECPATVIIIK